MSKFCLIWMPYMLGFAEVNVYFKLTRERSNIKIKDLSYGKNM